MGFVEQRTTVWVTNAPRKVRHQDVAAGAHGWDGCRVTRTSSRAWNCLPGTRLRRVATRTSRSPPTRAMLLVAVVRPPGAPHSPEVCVMARSASHLAPLAVAGLIVLAAGCSDNRPLDPRPPGAIATDVSAL